MDTITLVVLCVLALIVLIALIMCGLMSLQARERARQQRECEEGRLRIQRKTAEGESHLYGHRTDLTGVPNEFLRQEQREERTRQARLAASQDY